MRRSLIVAALAALLLVATLAPAGAAPPSDVFIEVTETISAGFGLFVASGSAVDDGLMCGTGYVITTSARVTGMTSTHFNWLGTKLFICDDSFGEFTVNMQARIEIDEGTTFRWVIVNGTGDYAGLHGAGSGQGIYVCGDDCVLDLYAGALH